MELLDQYNALEEQIHQYFGYVEDWVAIPMNDNTSMYWHLSGEGRGDNVRYAETQADLEDEDTGNYYEDQIYTQRFLPKWVYRGEEYTMIACDPMVDGNKFLRIFDNSKEIKELPED